MGEYVSDRVFDVDVDRFIEDWAGCSGSFENAGEDFFDESSNVGVFVTVVFGGFLGMRIGFEVRFVCADGGGYRSAAFVPENDEKG